MSWVRIDDAYTEHPKVVGLSDRAFRAHIEGLCYSARYRTDGELPPAVVKRWPSKIADELVAVGLWDWEVDGGVTIHDYLTYNLSRSEAEAMREARASAGRKGGLRSGEARRKQTPSKPEAVPVPQPVPPTPKGAESKGAPNGQVAPTGDETYLLEQLHRDPRWGPVTHGAIVALNRSYGRGVVTVALQRAVEETRDNLEIRSSPYGLLEAMCRDVAS